MPRNLLLLLRKVQVHWVRTISHCLPDVPSATGTPPTPAPQKGAEEYQVLLGFISKQRGEGRQRRSDLPLGPHCPCVAVSCGPVCELALRRSPRKTPW